MVALPTRQVALPTRSAVPTALILVLFFVSFTVCIRWLLVWRPLLGLSLRQSWKKDGKCIVIGCMYVCMCVCVYYVCMYYVRMYVHVHHGTLGV